MHSIDWTQNCVSELGRHQLAMVLWRVVYPEWLVDVGISVNGNQSIETLSKRMNDVVRYIISCNRETAEVNSLFVGALSQFVGDRILTLMKKYFLTRLDRVLSPTRISWRYFSWLKIDLPCLWRILHLSISFFQRFCAVTGENWPSLMIDRGNLRSYGRFDVIISLIYFVVNTLSFFACQYVVQGCFSGS